MKDVKEIDELTEPWCREDEDGLAVHLLRKMDAKDADWFSLELLCSIIAGDERLYIVWKHLNCMLS